MLFCTATQNQVEVVMDCLREFSMESGLDINLDKPKLYASQNIQRHVAASLSNACGIPLTSDLGVYLGVHILHGRQTKDTYKYLLEKIQVKLSSWKQKLLSMAGRRVLVQSVTSAIPTYTMQELKGQNLNGILPPELVRLPYLKNIDLTRNYRSGPIPPEWGSMQQIEHISLLGNRLTSSIPKQIGSLSALKIFTVEFNKLSGTLPSELGNLASIENLFLSSNNFIGELPTSFAKLTSLKDFRINDNRFIGRIPGFIQNWANLEKLLIHASGLMGPIPSNISELAQLIDLRISDLNGIDQAKFRPLTSTKLKTLILRSCNVTAELPEYLGKMTSLTALDLSFNKLSGKIPESFTNLMVTTNYIYLTGNLLTGPIHPWILQSSKSIDLSYNNFTHWSASCPQQRVNLFASYPGSNEPGIFSCLRRSKCQKKRYHLRINCGGDKVIVNKTTYEEDTKQEAASRLVVHDGGDWALSSTGHFFDDKQSVDSFILMTNSGLSMKDSELYISARFSAISTYYAFCMGNGNYTVNLHFAEIRFTDDKTCRSLGRRIFDIYIQGKLVQKDFNIVDKAGGVGKAIMRNFSATVTKGTLEIRLYWAGKGTTDIPVKGVYGPLISAITINPDFTPPFENWGMVVGILVGAAFAILLISGILWWKCCLRQKNTLEQDLKGLGLQTGSFSLRQIKAATNNFDPANKIGEGGFGPVYKGHLTDGKAIAVKQLSTKSKQGNREFVNEIGMISTLQHPHCYSFKD
ncbi:hypothetical protein SLA2020_244100 [Shorea laevis]